MKMLFHPCMVRKHHRSSPYWWEKVKGTSSHNQWLKYVRMGKDNFMKLVKNLSPYLEAESTMNITIEKQTAIALISMASGKSNAYIGRLFGISKSSVAIVIENVCDAIKSLMPQYLKVPEKSVLERNINDFENKWGFPQCAGVIGTIHVPVNTLNLPENASDYINSNKERSVLLQGVVDSNYKFWDVNIGWPGSVHESRVFTNSMLWLKGQDHNLFPDTLKELYGIKIPIYILAGTPYPQSHWVLGPFLNEASIKEKNFNEKFTFAYNTIEIAFKRLKARWMCLVQGNICSIEVLPSVIAACCVLHNICEMNNEIFLDSWIAKSENTFKQPIPLSCNIVIGPQIENIRMALADHFLNLASLSIL
ncbi:Protein ANTAGONIST OF LIKE HETEROCHROMATIN like protein [Argiope bruennichi]|uniref:Protein ANTAGONIST OF LIKE HETEROCHROMATIN like protein n=2 Tax=Argiope bruennichi TaxID=94029 RepID=A0A8T0FK93_ARGBR|nr:Protein ANTAGONIST OF LIKE HETEROCHROMATIN like protein [Argiope bruennichi]